MFGQGGLGGIARRHHQDAPGLGGGNRRRQRAADRTQFAGQAQLAEELVTQQRLRFNLAAGGEDAQRDGKVVAAAFLGQVGRGQVQGDAPLREIEARAEQGGTHALARLAHAGFGQADDLGDRQAAGEVHFHPHQWGIDPGAGTAVDQRQAHVWFLRRGA